MPSMNIAAKRGPMRQHQSSNGRTTRMLRQRNFGGNTTSDNNVLAQKTEPLTSTTPLLPICHLSVPELHCLGNMGFETLFVTYLLTALFCQYIYLYKTVWWYPVTLPPSTTSLNFHLIDEHLTIFLAVFLSRRLVWSVLWDFLRPSSDNAPAIMAWVLICFFTGIIWIFFLATPLVYLFYSTSFLNMIVLCYPILLWVPLTGLSGDSCFKLIINWSSMPETPRKTNLEFSDNMNLSSISNKHRSDVDSVTKQADCFEYNTSQINFANLGNSANPQTIRKEVKFLCQDFNSKVSEIVFCSMVCAYYVGLVPMFFMKSHQYYDMKWSLQHTVLVLLNSFALLSSHLLNPKYLHVLHKCALLLGQYKLLPGEKYLKDNMKEASGNRNNFEGTRKDISMQCDTNSDWASDLVIPIDTKVQYQGKFYQSCGIHNVAEPGDATHLRYYYMFNDPLRLMNWLLLGNIIVVLFQLYLLITSPKWDHLISLALMQFFSYYVLFRSLRDRIVLGNAHKFHKENFHNIPPVPVAK